jgi:glycine cleavage system H protein
VRTPENLKYTPADEWVMVEGDSATIGITDYAQDHLSDVVFAEIGVSVSDSIVQGKVIATIESVKAAADVSTPISGRVIEINEIINKTPEILNADPFGHAWLIKVKMNLPGELTNLMDAAAYRKYRAE